MKLQTHDKEDGIAASIFSLHLNSFSFIVLNFEMFLECVLIASFEDGI